MREHPDDTFTIANLARHVYSIDTITKEQPLAISRALRHVLECNPDWSIGERSRRNGRQQRNPAAKDHRHGHARRIDGGAARLVGGARSLLAAGSAKCASDVWLVSQQVDRGRGDGEHNDDQHHVFHLKLSSPAWIVTPRGLSLPRITPRRVAYAHAP